MGGYLSSQTRVMDEDIPPRNGLELSTNKIYIPQELLVTILSRVPEDRNVIDCRLVCKKWKDLIDGQDVWRERCHAKGYLIPRQIINKLDGLPLSFYRHIAIKNPYGRKNFILNNDGKLECRHWKSRLSGERMREPTTKWKVEDPPEGCDPLDGLSETNSWPDLHGIKTCFATSYELCDKWQVIDLVAQGCEEQVLDIVKPPIYICEFYAHRFDCGSIYELMVSLHGEEGNMIDEFLYKNEEIAFAGGKWSMVEHTFRDYPEGVRVIRFRHRGKDSQFWAGNYGSKMTGSTVRFLWE